MQARIQRHHILYDPEWILEIKMSWHRVISRIQNTKATSDQYRLLINFIHALTYEANRMRCELDTCRDCRVRKPKVSQTKGYMKAIRGKEVKTTMAKKVIFKRKKKKATGTLAMVYKLKEILEDAEKHAKSFDGGKKTASTDVRKCMQELKVEAQDIRMKVQEIRNKM